MPSKRSVWVLLIERSREKSTVTVHVSRESAWRLLVDYVKSAWDRKMPGVKQPKTERRLVDRFFEDVTEERYEIDREPIRDWKTQMPPPVKWGRAAKGTGPKGYSGATDMTGPSLPHRWMNRPR